MFKYALLISFMWLLLNSNSLLASESIAVESAAAATPSPESSAYSFFEIGLSGRAYTKLTRRTDDVVEALPTLRFGIKWENGFFMNFGDFGTRGNGVGYNFYSTKNWEFDALFHIGYGAFEVGETTNGNDLRLGLRATYFSDDAVFRMIASPIVIETNSDDDVFSSDDGYYVASWYAKNWQVKNWNIHGIIGASYYSADSLERRFSASIFENGEIIDLYTASAGAVLEFEIGASYALSKDWVFEARAGQTVVSNAIFDSPRVDRRGQTVLSIGVIYVF